MASLATNFTTFVFFVPIGLHRLHTSFSTYIKNPSQYCSKIWFFSEQKWKNFDLYALLIALPITSFSLLFIFFTISGSPNHRFSFLKQSFLVFLFWALLVLILVKENFELFSVPESFLFIIGCVLFFIEYALMGESFVGLSEEVDRLLGNLTLVCAFSCLFLSIKPSSFFAEFFLSSGVLFKGTWSLQTGLSLHTDVFGLHGCGNVLMPMIDGKSDIKCVVEDDKLRAMALMNFLFIVHAIFVMIVSFGLYGVLCYVRNLKSNEATGALLAGLDNEAMQIPAVSDYEFD